MIIKDIICYDNMFYNSTFSRQLFNMWKNLFPNFSCQAASVLQNIPHFYS